MKLNHVVLSKETVTELDSRLNVVHFPNFHKSDEFNRASV